MSLTLKEQITEAMKNAMRAKEKQRLGAIRLILSEIKRIEVDERIELDDSRVLAIMDKMVKQRNDSIKQFTDAQRLDLVDQEEVEIALIREFLPAALTEAEVSDMVSQAIADSGAQSMQDMGKVMGLLKPQIQGRADAGMVSKLVKSQLA